MTIKNKKRKKPKYKTGIYYPVNPKKYIGNLKKLIYKSKLELLYFRFLDRNKNILEWSYETITVPYISELDGRRHKYIIDIYCKLITKDKKIKRKLIEIKPLIQTKIPIKGPKEKESSFVYRLKEFTRNKSKWEFAEKFAKKNGMDFHKLTERDIL